MTNTIVELCDAVRPLQGQSIYLNTTNRQFCPDRTNCCSQMGRFTGKCPGHADLTKEQVVRVNFCELLSDRLVIHHSPLEDLRWRAAREPKGNLGKQRRLHIMESAGLRLESDERTSIMFTSGKLQIVEIFRPKWW